jgi:hypothetical protein
MSKLMKAVNGVMREMTDAEVAAAELLQQEWDSTATVRTLGFIRQERDKKLAETDWWASSDLTITDEQRTYRQALRDVPSQADPFNITWPTKPE